MSTTLTISTWFWPQTFFHCWWSQDTHFFDEAGNEEAFSNGGSAMFICPAALAEGYALSQPLVRRDTICMPLLYLRRTTHCHIPKPLLQLRTPLPHLRPFFQPFRRRRFIRCSSFDGFYVRINVPVESQQGIISKINKQNPPKPNLTARWYRSPG